MKIVELNTVIDSQSGDLEPWKTSMTAVGRQVLPYPKYRED